jgi:hypothetical protein
MKNRKPHIRIRYRAGNMPCDGWWAVITRPGNYTIVTAPMMFLESVMRSRELKDATC